MSALITSQQHVAASGLQLHGHAVPTFAFAESESGAEGEDLDGDDEDGGVMRR